MNLYPKIRAPFILSRRSGKTPRPSIRRSMAALVIEEEEREQAQRKVHARLLHSQSLTLTEI